MTPNETRKSVVQLWCHRCKTMILADSVQLYCKGMRIAETNICQQCTQTLYHWRMSDEIVTFKGHPIVPDPPEPKKQDKKQLRLF